VDLGRRLWLPVALDRRANRLGSDRLLLGDRQPQRVLHGILTVVGGQVEDLQVFTGGHPGAVIAEQLIVGHAEVTRGKHVGPILVVFQGAGLANQ